MQETHSPQRKQVNSHRVFLMLKYLSIGIILGCLFFSFLGYAFFLYEIKTPRTFYLQEEFFTIHPGEGIKEFAFELGKGKDALISNPLLFYWYIKFFGNDRNIQPGEYKIHSPASIKDIASLLKNGPNAQVTVIFPEGFTIKQIVSRLNAHGFSLQESYFSQIPESFRNYYDLPEHASLEGFLFPDHYVFRTHEQTKEIISAFLTNFKNRLPGDWLKEIETKKYSLFSVITMASILEKEVKTLEEKKIAAGILWKRLVAGIPLQVDATINYIAGNPKEITKINTAIDSTYNTYTHQGLPPGPISNPGLASIEAAIFPQKSDYWFYLSRQDTGQTIFSKTIQEHERAKVLYLR